MKKRKSFSKFDYFLMLFEDFKDQFTLVIILNLLLIFVSIQLDFLYNQFYLFSSFKDYFNEFSFQFSLNDFFKILGYIYLFATFVHFGIYKKNVKLLFYINSIILIIVTTYVWSIPTLDSVFLILEKGHIFFILALIAQFVVYMVIGNEFYNLIKKKIKKVEINHS